MLRAASNTLLIAAVLVIAAGCGDPCEDAEEACKACGTDAETCRSRVEICELTPGPVGEADCCERLEDSWDGC